jgi:hypothetical protein
VPRRRVRKAASPWRQARRWSVSRSAVQPTKAAGTRAARQHPRTVRRQ